MKQAIEQTLRGHRIIPVVEIDDAEHAVALSEALLAGGISVIEITLRTPAGVRAIERIARDVPDILVGAGTVLTLEESHQARDAGAQFGVAPGTNRQVVESFHLAGLPFLPGAITPTEIEMAMDAGCRLLKFFPASVSGGPPMLKALQGPYSHKGIQFCATGGIGADNLRDYLSLNAVWAVGGSWLATRRQIADQHWASITAGAKTAVLDASN